MVEVDSFLAADDGRRPSLVGLLFDVDSEGLAAPGCHMVVVVDASDGKWHYYLILPPKNEWRQEIELRVVENGSPLILLSR